MSLKYLNYKMAIIFQFLLSMTNTVENAGNADVKEDVIKIRILTMLNSHHC